MASYLDRLITLDEDGTENLDTSFEAEQTQDITEVIDVDTNNDEINAEAVAIEEDLEAMQDGTEAVGELAEQESVNDELLESPGDISPEVAKATNDAFKVTLAGLAIDVRDTVYGNITYDSNRNEPIEVVRITNDGVKDFLSKIKEHIIAFFRTIKAKIQKLIAKLFTMFADVTKKGEALHKQIKNKIARLENKSRVIKVEDHATKRKIIDYMPVLFMSNGGDIKKSIDSIVELFGKGGTAPFTLNIVDEIIKAITANVEKTPKNLIDDINSKINSQQKDYYKTAITEKFEVPTAKDHNVSNGIVAGGVFTRNLQMCAFKIHEDSEVIIPSVVWYTGKITQSEIDSVSISGVAPNEILSMVDAAIKIGKASEPRCKFGYKHLADMEKEIINSCDKLAKDADVSNGTYIKLSSVCRSIAASITFKTIMDQAKAGRRVLALANYLYNQLESDAKDAAKEEKRNRNNP